MSDLFDAIAYTLDFVFSADGAQFFATFGAGFIFGWLLIYFLYAPPKRKPRHPYLF